jgi:hypothetical protein
MDTLEHRRTRGVVYKNVIKQVHQRTQAPRTPLIETHRCSCAALLSTKCGHILARNPFFRIFAAAPSIFCDVLFLVLVCFGVAAN